ncbi:hypothetical protein BEP19_11650 [Ammoniphilus oxalaticus]|uniref:Transporter n=1 Tax=Ammoniphilus oxalaticus TaxID=66863 RepID=A0A419SGM4_9BACL|nr:hypothetical protein [Ammoniphilus oxalaticus]RKD22885.1 hypothetical protein BEP19_11650 [Ammoniphilus oxalaticus]
MGIGRAVKVGLTIIGTTIGAGFASGREIWEFFGSYGSASQYSLMLAMALLFVMIAVILWISRRKETTHYYGILEELMGQKLAKMFDGLTMLYLLSMSVVMFAGSGATFTQWEFPYMLGVALMALAVFVVLLFNVNGLVSIQSLIIPILIGVLFIVCVRFILGVDMETVTAPPPATTSWPSGITYAALNIVPLLAVLSTLGQQLKTRKELWIAAGLSAGGLGMIALLLNQSLLLSVDQIGAYEIPLFALLQNDSMVTMIVVSVVLWFAIYTTALSGVHGIVSRIDTFFTIPSWMVTLIIIIGMIPLSLFGFSTLVSLLYPIYGVLNLFVLGLLILYPLNRMLE